VKNETIFLTVKKEGCKDVELMILIKLLPEADNNIPQLPTCTGINDTLFQVTLSPKEIVAWSWQGGVPNGMTVTLCDRKGLCSTGQTVDLSGQFLLTIPKDNTSECGQVYLFVLGKNCLSAFNMFLTPPPFSGG